MPIGFTTTLFASSYPFYGGSLSATRPLPYTVHLAGQDYPVDLRQYRRNGLETLRQGAVNTTEPNDALLNPEGAWSRYGTRWDHGTGQEVLDLDDESDRKRFYASRGVDVWDKGRLTLHRSMEVVLDEAATALTMIATDQHVYVGHDSVLERSNDLSTWDTITGLGFGTINALSTDGTDVYVATVGDLYRVSPAGLGATSLLAAPAAHDNVGFVGGRLLASRGAEIGEVLASGGGTFDSIYTHWQPSFAWTTIFNVGSRIYAGGYAGNRSELYSFQDDAGSLVRAQEAAPFAYGELLRGALAYGGAVILYSSLGVRFAQVGGDGSLTYGPLIDVGNDIRCATAEGRFVWFGWNAYPGGGVGLGRLALDSFVDTMQPAFAADVVDESSSSEASAVVRFQDRTVLAVLNEHIVATSEDEYMTEGWLDTGDVYFGTVEPKNANEILVRHHPLVLGEAVNVIVTDQLGTTLGDGTSVAAGATGVAVDLDAAPAEHIAVRITLEGDGDTTPTVTLWRARAYVTAPTTEVWLVPLILSSLAVVNDGQGQVKSYAVLAEAEALIDFWRTKQRVAYREGDRIYRVRVDNYEMQPWKWDDGSNFFEAIFVVKLVTV